MKKDVAFARKHDQQTAFQRVKDVLASPHTMVSPVKGLPLTLYLTSTNKLNGALLAQEVDGIEKPVYYLS